MRLAKRIVDRMTDYVATSSSSDEELKKSLELIVEEEISNALDAILVPVQMVDDDEEDEIESIFSISRE